ncbi:RNA polymerase sigma factor [Aequorivita sp. F47161]|uniref:RNA polymerase sigma factor n=1 Tax=Aequorivita vitellina TaxID=2874475 RepID=A0A9X1QZY4_9FLAO|nr:RNA polymerase sigma factor [Aequorivita vitellina]MCG2419654.1 RNA polymerase sigma factor [Aequorivita vitellina]MCZ4320060.1 RNA polymerase sigma factor [Aequorivita viscosa]
MNTNTIEQKEPTEAIIIEKILDGQVELFEILMRRYNELLYRTIRSYITIETDAEDTMQDTYIKAFQKLYQFKNEARFSTWLIRIGINEALQRKRKANRYQTVAIQQEDKVLQIEDRNIMDPERKTMYKESSYFIEKAIDTLPEKYKIVYMLKEVEGIGISEISSSLDLSNSNVKVRLHRARIMLRDSILNLTDHSTIFDFGNSKCDTIVANVMDYIFKMHPYH